LPTLARGPLHSCVKPRMQEPAEAIHGTPEHPEHPENPVHVADDIQPNEVTLDTPEHPVYVRDDVQPNQDTTCVQPGAEQDEASETPEMPDVPDMPGMPDMVNMPVMPERPEMTEWAQSVGLLSPSGSQSFMMLHEVAAGLAAARASQLAFADENHQVLDNLPEHESTWDSADAAETQAFADENPQMLDNLPEHESTWNSADAAETEDDCDSVSGKQDEVHGVSVGKQESFGKINSCRADFFTGFPRSQSMHSTSDVSEAESVSRENVPLWPRSMQAQSARPGFDWTTFRTSSRPSVSSSCTLGSATFGARALPWHAQPPTQPPGTGGA